MPAIGREHIAYPPTSYRSEGGGYRGGGGGGGGERGGGGGRGKPPGIRLVVSGVSRDTSWQVCFVAHSFLAHAIWPIPIIVESSSSCTLSLLERPLGGSVLAMA